MAYTEELGYYIAARMFRGSRIFRGIGTLVYSWGCGTTARTGIAVTAAHTTLRHPDPVEGTPTLPILALPVG